MKGVFYANLLLAGMLCVLGGIAGLAGTAIGMVFGPIAGAIGGTTGVLAGIVIGGFAGGVLTLAINILGDKRRPAPNSARRR